ncbi:MAG: hypothetical protein O3C10_07610 [Chloroflexi bacterium]|nr:hypothetical protein [Chloroflexota bacterium]
MQNLNRTALVWSAVWITLIVLLTAQLALKSIPDGDTLLIGVDAAAIVFVLIRLKRALAVLKNPGGPPDQES